MITTPRVRRVACATAATATALATILIGPVSAAPTDSTPGNARMGERLRRDPATSGLSAHARAPKGVLGIDVSSYQGDVNWKKWDKKGKSFAYIKATEGTSYKNPYFATQYANSFNAGFVRGAYHFANPAGKSGKKQARYFVQYGGAWAADGQTLPGALDIEYNPNGKTCYGLSKKKMRAWIKSFLTEYEDLTGRQAVIYTTLDWWTMCTGNTTKFRKTNPLWAARWGTEDAGKLPGKWKETTFWQYSDDPIDQNWFNGNASELIDFADNPPEPSPAGQR